MKTMARRRHGLFRWSLAELGLEWEVLGLMNGRVGYLLMDDGSLKSIGKG